jgi:hypothetical protein
MSNTQFGWLIAPQLLLLLVIIGGWAKYRIERWISQLVRECTSPLEQKDHRLIANLERLRELIEKQSAEVGRIRDYLLAPPRP